MSPVLLDIVNFIGWIIFTITYREPNKQRENACSKNPSTLLGMLLNQNSKHLKGQLRPL